MLTDWFERLKRLLRHAWFDQRSVQAMLDAPAQARLAAHIVASEARHRGELRVCLEAGLSPSAIWRGTTPRERAIELFGRLGVWDTEHNNGVLIYLLVADRRIEILADRGLIHQVPTGTWQAAVEHLGQQVQSGQLEQGLHQAIEHVGQLLQQHYPLPAGTGLKPNELPDAVVVI